MMKKLMILSLVMAIGGLASASLLDIKVGDLAVADGLEVISDGSLALSAVTAVDTVGYDLTISVTGDLALVTDGTEFPGEGTTWMFGNKFVGAPTAAQARVTGGAFMAVAAGTPAFGNLIVAGQRGTIIFDELDVNTQERIVTEVSVIPEPMTMGLLGVGALFLRRRK